MKMIGTFYYDKDRNVLVLEIPVEGGKTKKRPTIMDCDYEYEYPEGRFE